MADYAPEVKRLLREAGCYPVRQGKGDHEIWFSPITGRKFVVDSKIKSRHTANAVLKQAGLPKSFRALLSIVRKNGSTSSRFISRSIHPETAGYRSKFQEGPSEKTASGRE